MNRKGSALYLECSSGISGDMTVAALLDLGADREVLKRVLRSLPIHGFRIKISRVKKAGLDVCDFHVILDEAHENHDHDMEYLFSQGAVSGGEREEHCGHDHSGGGQQGGHEHRRLPEILDIIRRTEMTDGAKKIAEKIFHILAAAEAKAHGVPEKEVHFHEVGAVDSIVDIVSAAVCLDNLGVSECVVPALCEGTGMIRCQHGMLSVPVPAVLNIVQEHQLELSITDIRGELVTPTGAAIVAAVKTADKLPKRFRVLKTGMGGGKREYERPSILRAMLIEELSDEVNPGEEDSADWTQEKGERGEKAKTDTVNKSDKKVQNGVKSDDVDVIYKLETNIDDCSGEMLGYVMDRLLEAGARDVHYTPVYMKKNRPAYQLNVLCREEQIPVLENIIFTETTTIGIRRQRMERSVLPRRSLEVLTEIGNARVKECRLQEQRGVRYYPEYDSVVKLCRASGRPFAEVYRLVSEQCRNGKLRDVGKEAAKRWSMRRLRKKKYEDLL